ncbi:MAG: HAMP domain-containing sensor histidine kinase [Prolixibacteraceae bacterium]|nr:HAMP domain-containing sensor histidine kinase [Prolixibacteraceae bacterium]
MKIEKQTILALFTFFALLIILFVQVNWVFKAAKLEEEHFNSNINNALADARKEIAQSVKECPDMQRYLCGHQCKGDIREQKINELDSIIRSNLEIQNINLDYTFEITDTTVIQRNKIFGNRCYLQSLNGLLEKENIKISLEFPARNQFILAQIRGVFLLAFISIIFVAVSFFITLKLFKKERMMLVQTSDFINNMVHEFQTPLSNIRFAANLGRKKAEKIHDEKLLEYINVILTENHKLGHNVEQILKLSSTSNNDSGYETIDMNQVITQVIESFRHRTESLKARTELHLNARESRIKGSLEHFRLIVSNLYDNALKYSPKDPHIIISTKNDNKKLIFSIQDNGIGIDKKYHRKIFEKYYRVSTGDIHNVKGFGLGLTLVKRIVEKYNGTITVSETKEQNTIFTIILPLNNEAN